MGAAIRCIPDHALIKVTGLAHLTTYLSRAQSREYCVEQSTLDSTTGLPVGTASLSHGCILKNPRIRPLSSV